MVKDVTTPRQTQREAIDSALRRLGLRPEQEGFASLGEEVSLKGRTLYRAWLGNIGLSGSALVALAKAGAPAADAAGATPEAEPRKIREEVGFILRNGSRDQVNLFKALVESVHRQVADSHPHGAAA